MDLELNNVNTEAQPNATITNPGGLASEPIPDNQEGVETYSKLTKELHEIEQ